ncbi:type II toxin-antitoxin system VapC family toxin [Thermoflexus sp.]|uniref:type II toxin-antitoxin system VapC family toxin n=1 Tax=Thermoflexus sp. TaxID=1969742 RepID=UPI002ADE7C07|nr:PIN domain-containing protein [Thermoflexus sp.]
MYLVDTNVWLERFLDQARAEEVGDFLNRTPSDQLCITDFAFHSIGIVLGRLNKAQAFLQFVQDAFLDGAVSLIRLEPEDMQRVVGIMAEYHLDFDDAYPYAAAEKHRLTLVSFDADFDRTPLGRKTPAEMFPS